MSHLVSSCSVLRLTHGVPPDSAPRVASSSAAIGKLSRSVFVSQSSARRGDSDENSVLNPDDTTSTYSLRPLSTMALSFGFDHGYRLPDILAGAQRLRHGTIAGWCILRHYVGAKVPYSMRGLLPSPFPIYAVPTRFHRLTPYT